MAKYAGIAALAEDAPRQLWLHHFELLGWWPSHPESWILEKTFCLPGSGPFCLLT